MAKLETAKNIHLQLWFILTFNSEKVVPFELMTMFMSWLWLMFWDKHCQSVSIQQNNFHIKWERLFTFWIFFVISSFAIIEEVTFFSSPWIFKASSDENPFAKSDVRKKEFDFPRDISVCCNQLQLFWMKS